MLRKSPATSLIIVGAFLLSCKTVHNRENSSSGAIKADTPGSAYALKGEVFFGACDLKIDNQLVACTEYYTSAEDRKEDCERQTQTIEEDDPTNPFARQIDMVASLVDSCPSKDILYGCINGPSEWIKAEDVVQQEIIWHYKARIKLGFTYTECSEDDVKVELANI